MKKERKVRFWVNLCNVDFQRAGELIFWNLKLKFYGKTIKTFISVFIEGGFLKSVLNFKFISFKFYVYQFL